MMKITMIILMIAIGARFSMNAMKVSSFTALPIMMFGGSPMSVAVPPIFDARICVSRKGIGFKCSFCVMLKVTGTMRSTVVTLSRNAEKTAVMMAR